MRGVPRAPRRRRSDPEPTTHLGDWRRLDRLARLGGLLAEVAHEVRNPVAVLRSLIALLPEQADDPEFRERFAEIAGSELARLERLLDSVLAQAGDGAAPAKAAGACEIGAAVESVTRLLAHRAAAAGVHLASELPPVLPRAPLAPDALRQVLLNLALNALEATPSGGDVRLGARALGRAVELSVEDRGSGVPRALRRRVFEPFYTSADRPGGLGLTISRELVEAAGGTIAIGDRPGGGSRFRVRLPV
ncbi:MAG TPA: HAMP domain-containing sensor histidine kinase [Myxococcota bacterium]|nr:HAMP domain-containing sensor histidine kinase [Myxococcota bacterium]